MAFRIAMECRRTGPCRCQQGPALTSVQHPLAKCMELMLSSILNPSGPSAWAFRLDDNHRFERQYVIEAGGLT